MSSLSLRDSLGIGRSQQEVRPIIDFDSQAKGFRVRREKTVMIMPGPLQIISFAQQHIPGTLSARQSIPEDASVENIIGRLQEALQIRPVASVQFLWNEFDTEPSEDAFYKALSYCGYVFQNGPWKGSVVRFDVDPRMNPAYRKYQTIHLPVNEDPIVFGADGTLNLLVGFSAHRPAHRQCHIFDGQTITAGVQSWQLCDITDNQLSRVISTETFHMVPCEATGYLLNGTWVKLEQIMWDKLICLRDGNLLLLDDYEKLLAIPDEYKFDGKIDRIRYGFKFGERDTRKNAFLRRTILERIKDFEV
jgi:general transcription factor 3C polypeptide 5 (transcription factor C subunit 1)